jgi:hypothetical protein
LISIVKEWSVYASTPPILVKDASIQVLSLT